MTATDVIIYWDHSGFPKKAKAAIRRPTRFIVMPKGEGGAFTGFRESVEALGSQPLRALMEREGIQPLRVAVIGFSASCQGVTAFLRSQDGGLIETAIAVDGIHGGVDHWVNYARLAAFGVPPESPLPQGRRFCIITHSACARPRADIPNTTETAQEIIGRVFGEAADLTSEDDVAGLWMAKLEPYSCSGITYTTSPSKYMLIKGRGGLHIYGYENVDPAGRCDHIYQAQRILPRVCERLLVDRWNAEDPLESCRMV